MTGSIVEATVIDLSGKFCPEVVLCVSSQINQMARPALLEVISTDPLSEIDVPLYVMRAGLGLLRQWRQDGSIHFMITLPEPGPQSEPKRTEDSND